MRKRYKTARCVLQHRDTFLLAVHSRFWRARIKRWGLPGGGVEWREDPEEAARRELVEELELYVPRLQPVGAYEYKRANHMVYASGVDAAVDSFDDSELVAIRWFTLTEVEQLERDNLLHAGYELDAIRAYLAMQQGTSARAIC